MSKKIFSIILVMLMILPMIFSLASCEKERTEEEIINDIVNSGTTALTLSIWIPTNSDTETQQFKDRLSKVESEINEILRDKNLSTEIELTAVASDEYETKLTEHLNDIELKVEAKKGILPSNVSQSYVNKAVKIPYGDSYMYELAYPDVLETQIDLFMIRDYDSYKKLVQKENLYALDSYLSTEGGKYADIRKMISPAVFSKYVVNKLTYAIPNNHQFSDAKYQYILIDKSAFDSIDGMDINNVTDIFACEEFINAISTNEDYVPFVGTLNDAPGIFMFDDTGLVGSSIDSPTPSSIFDVESYTKYVEFYKKLTESSLVKESLSDGEKSAVSFFYGTNDEVKFYEENYYVVKSEKPIANTEDIFSSMFAISKYSANYDRAMKILYLFQTDSDIITLLQYGIEGEDYTLEYDENGDKRIQVSNDTVYDMTGLNIGNSYFTYKNDGATIDEWGSVKESNYDLCVYPYLHFSNNFDNSATEEEKTQLETLKNSVNNVSLEVMSSINDMSYDEYVVFLELLNYDIKAIEEEIVKLEKQLSDEQAKEEPNEEMISDLETKLNEEKAKKSAYDSNEVVVKINSSDDLKNLIALYNNLYAKYN